MIISMHGGIVHNILVLLAQCRDVAVEKNRNVVVIIRSVEVFHKMNVYRVIQNFASPSRAENRQASAKLTISPFLIQLI